MMEDLFPHLVDDRA